jgi:hypothetical protein
LYVLYYENYSTGERFKRLNVRSEDSPGLPENVFTIQDILNNVARKSREFTFINVNTSEEFTFPESLIISENIDCEQFDYNFEDIPPKIKNLAINKQFIPLLFKKNTSQLKECLSDLKKNTSNPVIKEEINNILKQDSNYEQKKKYIKLLIENGIADSDTPLDFETVKSLKNLLRLSGIFFK